jgi:hypothetical protein
MGLWNAGDRSTKAHVGEIEQHLGLTIAEEDEPRDEHRGDQSHGVPDDAA